MKPNWLVAAALALTLLAAGCGGGIQRPGTRSASAAPAPGAPRASAAKHVRFLSPRPGAHTGSTLTVRTVLLIGRRRISGQLRYVLDGGPARRGSGRFRLAHLSPGHHRLTATLIGAPGARATVGFFVRRRRPPAAPTPAVTTPVAPTTSTAPLTTTTTATSPPPAAPPATTPPPAAPPPQSTTTTTAPGGIPQHNGGDGDSDNNGGPSDGDGNL